MMPGEWRQREILRYLGYKAKDVPDPAVLSLIGEMAGVLAEQMEPGRVFRIFPVEGVKEGQVDLGFSVIHSRDLAKNLEGCSQAAFLAATLGSRTERLVQRYRRMQMSRAVVFEAVCTEAIERYCDGCEEEIRRMLGPGWGLRPRFSPGYGDFPLEYQRELLGVLDAAKRIGLTLTDSLLMAPSKSVTAVIGVYEAADMPGGCGRGEDLPGRGAHGCAGCGKEDCAYRRN